MNVAFLNENTLGHTSYLPRFAEALRGRRELGVTPHVFDVLPLPPHLRAAFRGRRGRGWSRAVRHAKPVEQSL